MQKEDLLVWQNAEVQQWLHNHATDDPTRLLLGAPPLGDLVPPKALAQQLAGWQKARQKLPSYYNTPGLAYPPSLSMEQCSSEDTARWKSQFLNGKRFADLTGGFGVDAHFLGLSFEEVHYVERNEELAALAKHNFGILRPAHIQVHQQLAEDFLDQLTEPFDWFYLDPARRDEQQGRVFRLADCTPNAAELAPGLLQKSTRVMLKASPLLDIQQGLQELGGAEKVIVLAVKNEVKELLYILGPESTDDPEILGVNLTPSEEERFEIRRSEESRSQAPIGAITEYVYEPNAALMKAGAFNALACRFGLQKLHPNTHLYTHTEKVISFPGRKFRVKEVLPAQKKALRKAIPQGKAHVAVRNFPLTADQLRAKLALQEGGALFVYGFTNHEGQKQVAILERWEASTDNLA